MMIVREKKSSLQDKVDDCVEEEKEKRMKNFQREKYLYAWGAFPIRQSRGLKSLASPFTLRS